jgi:hypothetical protein
MADPTPTSGATPDPAATAGGGSDPGTDETTTGDPRVDQIGDAGRRAIAELRKELKTIKTERDELAAAQQAVADRDKTELEKAQERATRAESRIAELEQETRARTAAAAAGIPDQWHRLRGSTDDELKADADQLAEAFGKRPGGGGLTPADLGAGPRPDAPATGSQGMNQRIRRAAGRS